MYTYDVPRMLSFIRCFDMYVWHNTYVFSSNSLFRRTACTVHPISCSDRFGLVCMIVSQSWHSQRGCRESATKFKRQFLPESTTHFFELAQSSQTRRIGRNSAPNPPELTFFRERIFLYSRKWFLKWIISVFLIYVSWANVFTFFCNLGYVHHVTMVGPMGNKLRSDNRPIKSEKCAFYHTEGKNIRHRCL